MRKTISLPVAAALILIAHLSFANQQYQFKDLLALEASKNWSELVDHLSDIAPQERNAQWNTLVMNALVQRLSELESENDQGKILVFLESVVSKYPIIKAQKNFMDRRNAFGLKYYSNCFRHNSDDCHQKYLGFVRQDPDAGQAFIAAKEVRQHMSDVKAILYFSFALAQKNLDNKLCDDDDLKLSLSKTLVLDGKREEAIAAKSIAFGQCFASVKSTIVQAILENNAGMSNACAEMLEKNALSGVAAGKCNRFIKGESK